MKTQKLNDSPYIALVTDFLTPDEVNHLVVTATPGLRKAEIIDPKTGAGQIHEYRTGLNHCFGAGQDMVIKEIENRIASFCHVRLSQLEYVQVNKYSPGDEFKAHHDWLDSSLEGHQNQLKMGGQRIFTTLLYLNDPEDGGETAFDMLKLTVKPVKGAMLVFSNLKKDGKVDERTLHASRPLVKGEKWAATCWIRERSFDGSEEASFEQLKKAAEETASGLRRKLAEMKKQATAEGHAEILAVCARRGLILAPYPVISPDGRLAAYTEIEIDPKSPVWTEDGS